MSGSPASDPKSQRLLSRDALRTLVDFVNKARKPSAGERHAASCTAKHKTCRRGKIIP